MAIKNKVFESRLIISFFQSFTSQAALMEYLHRPESPRG